MNGILVLAAAISLHAYFFANDIMPFYVLGGVAYLAVTTVAAILIFLITRLYHQEMKLMGSKSVSLSQSGVLSDIKTGSSKQLFNPNSMNAPFSMEMVKYVGIGLFLSWLGIFLVFFYFILTVLANKAAYQAFINGDTTGLEKLMGKNDDN